MTEPTLTPGTLYIDRDLDVIPTKSGISYNWEMLKKDVFLTIEG